MYEELSIAFSLLASRWRYWWLFLHSWYLMIHEILVEPMRYPTTIAQVYIPTSPLISKPCLHFQPSTTSPSIQTNISTTYLQSLLFLNQSFQSNKAIKQNPQLAERKNHLPIPLEAHPSHNHHIPIFYPISAAQVHLDPGPHPFTKRKDQWHAFCYSFLYLISSLFLLLLFLHLPSTIDTPAQLSPYHSPNPYHLPRHTNPTTHRPRAQSSPRSPQTSPAPLTQYILSCPLII